MERLTDKIGNTNCVKGCGSNCKYGFQYCCKEDWENCQTISDVIDKLAYYEDLEKQGRLINLPCKVGDTVYVKMASYCKTHYAEAEVRDFVHFISCGFCAVVTSKYFDKENIPFSEFGKTVFLTKSAAEAKLKELRGGENDNS